MIWKLFVIGICLFLVFTCWAVCYVGANYPKGGSSERKNNE